MFCLIFLLGHNSLVTELMAKYCIIIIEINFNVLYVILCFYWYFEISLKQKKFHIAKHSSMGESEFREVFVPRRH